MTLRRRYSRARNADRLGTLSSGLEPDTPENRLMYLGSVPIVVAAALWIGAELTRRVEWTVPYIGIGGIGRPRLKQGQRRARTVSVCSAYEP